MKNAIVRIRRSFLSLVVDTKGANLVEYMILVGAVALVSLAAATTFKDDVKAQFEKEGQAVQAIPTK